MFSILKQKHNDEELTEYFSKLMNPLMNREAQKMSLHKDVEEAVNIVAEQ